MVATGDGVSGYTNSASAFLEATCWQTFSEKGQMVNIGHFMGLMVSAACTQLCSYKRKAVIDSM